MTFCKIIIKAMWEKEKALLNGAILKPSESFRSSHCLQGQQIFTFFPFLQQPVYPSQLSSTESKQSVKKKNNK